MKTIEAVQSVVAPIKRAGQVEDDRLKALYQYKAAETIKENKETLTDLANGKTDIGLNVSLGTSKAESSYISETELNQGSTIHATGDVNIKATEKDITVKGSEIIGENVNLDAKENINVIAGTNKNVGKGDNSSSSASIGVSIGLSGITGINAGYNKANGEVKENAETHVASTITAKDTLTTKSGQDTNIIGSKIEGETIKMEVGKDLNIESLQDKETYDEKNNSSGFNFSVDVSQPKGKPATYENGGITGGKNKGKTNSNYERVTDQAGIYAGEGGFDIEVGKNTDLKGAVISSEADASKNKLSTDTLTYSDIENKAEYSASSSGFNFDSKGEIPITPKQGMPVNGEAESTTKSAIAEGTIEIRSNENQNISNLSRNTQEALNKLEKIFDAKTVKEQQELADLFGEVAFKAVGDIADRNWKNAKTPEEKAKWAEGGEYKILLHTFVGGMMSEFAGNGFKSGAISAGISQALQNQLSKIEDKGLRLIAGGLVAGTVNKVLGLKPEVGSSIAISGIKNNDYCHRPTTEGAYIFVEGQGYFIIENGIDVYMQGDVPPAGAVVWYQDYDNPDYGDEFIKGDGGINLSDTYFQWEERTIIAGAGMAQQYVKIRVAIDDKGNDISVNGGPLINPDDYGKYAEALKRYNYYGGESMDAKAAMILFLGPNTTVLKTRNAMNIENPLANIRYTDKVKSQAALGDYHGFPESVDGFGANGKVTWITGGDNIVRSKVEILGSYKGKNGIFEYILELDGVTCNHRLFIPIE